MIASFILLALDFSLLAGLTSAPQHRNQDQGQDQEHNDNHD